MSELKIIPNPDTDKYAEMTVKIFNNSGFCPCVTDKSDDTKCPCKEFRKQQTEGLCRGERWMKVRKE